VLNKITFTGADDTTDPNALLDVLADFPLAEAGILVGSHDGIPRFPTMPWIRELDAACLRRCVRRRLSFHLCGRWTRDVFRERGAWFELLGKFAFIFDRVQLNTHGETHLVHSPNLLDNLAWAAHLNRQVIFQGDRANDEVFDWVLDLTKKNPIGLDLAVLFDESHGAGISPPGWRVPLCGVYCGYAGGLGPENVQPWLAQISEMVKLARLGNPGDEVPYWIDAETRLMSHETGHLDLDLVRRYLTSATKWAVEKGG